MLLKFLRDRSGNLGVMSALLLVPLFGAVGLAVDYTGALRMQSVLQNAADASVLAAAATPGKEQTVSHGFLAGHLGADAIEGKYDVSVEGNLVSVNARGDYKTTFIHILGIGSVPLAVQAKAMRSAGSSACILILDPDKADALKIINANAVASDCGFQVNSANSQRAFYIDNGGKFSAPLVAVHGKSKVSGKMLSPAPVDGSPVIADPLQTMAEPVPSTTACTSNGLKTIDTQVKLTINPGVYCGGLTLNASDDVTFKPGIYTFRGGPLTLNTSARLLGAGVLFYFEDEQSPLLMNGSAIMQISAPTTGPHAGILMFQGRKAINADIQFRINTAAGSFYDGTIYLPYTVIDWNVSGSANAEASYTALIAKRLNLSVSGTVVFKKPPASGPVPVPTALAGTPQVRLVR